MATFTLTINPNYVPSWTDSWEALREFVQNGLDAADKGHEFSATWTPNLKLKLTNRGARIDRKHLLLGATTKADDPSARGHFGEGFKLALLVLARNNVAVKIKTGGESWTPKIAHSKEFGADLLQITTAPCKDDGNTTVIVEKVSKEAWDALKERIIPLRDKVPERIQTEHGDILLDPADQGHVFVKDIHVFSDSKLSYGYNFKALKLDRDRKMANVWDLEWEVKKVMQEAVASGAFKASEMLKILSLETSSREATALANYDFHGPSSETAKQKLKDAFTSIHGDALPVTSMDDAMEAMATGIPAVVTSKALVRLFNTESEMHERKARKAQSTKQLIQPSDLTEAEQQVWLDGRRILKAIAPDATEYAVHIVEFESPDILGSISSSDRVIRLARNQLVSVGAMVGTLIHELAHRECPDHSMKHAQAMEQLFEAAINFLHKPKA